MCQNHWYLTGKVMSNLRTFVKIRRKPWEKGRHVLRFHMKTMLIKDTSNVLLPSYGNLKNKVVSTAHCILKYWVCTVFRFKKVNLSLVNWKELLQFKKCRSMPILTKNCCQIIIGSHCVILEKYHCPYITYSFILISLKFLPVTNCKVLPNN